MIASDHYKIGVDLGGTKTSVAVLDENNERIFSRREPTPASNYSNILDLIASLVEEAKKETGAAAAMPVGVGIPGALDNRGFVKNANTVSLIGKPLLSDLNNKLGADVHIANDATCFVASEARDGAGKGGGVVFGVIAGTGVGGGIAVNGTAISGENGLTGEWGHNPFPFYGETPKNRQCYCGKTDCIETILSGPALALDYRELTGRSLTAREIYAAYKQNDKHAAAALNNFFRNFAKALSTVINVLDPNIVVVGGGLSNIDELYETAPKFLGDYVFNASANPAPVATRLVKNRWGDDSGVRGAAWLTAK